MIGEGLSQTAPYWATPIEATAVHLTGVRVAVHCPEVVEERILDSILYAPAIASGPGHYRYGIVRAVGPGGYLKSGQRDPMQVQVGDRVFIGRHVSGEEFQMPWGEACWVVLEDDIVGKLVPYTGGLNPPVDADRQWEIQPFADRVLVEHHPSPPIGFKDFARHIEAAEKRIVLPSAYITCERGTIVARGPGWRNDQGVTLPMESEPGQTIYFAGDTGQLVRLAGHHYWMMREDEIEAVEDVPSMPGNYTEMIIEWAATENRPWLDLYGERMATMRQPEFRVTQIGPWHYVEVTEGVSEFIPGQGRVTKRETREYYDAACRHPRVRTENLMAAHLDSRP